jgi:RHS repeat-associated protein
VLPRTKFTHAFTDIYLNSRIAHNSDCYGLREPRWGTAELASAVKSGRCTCRPCGHTETLRLIADGRGNVVALADATGNVVDRYRYNVWGVPTISLEDVPQPLLYAGYWYDRELGMPGETAGWYWPSVRAYDPALKRFLQPDPSQIEGLRSYVYVGDDPVDATDPSGLIGSTWTIPRWSRPSDTGLASGLC